MTQRSRKPILFSIIAVALVAVLLVLWRTGKFGGPAEPKLRQVEQLGFTMNTVARVVAYGENPEEAVAQALAEADRIARLTDRFDAQSDVSKINSARGAWVTVAPEVVEVADQAVHWGRVTGGAFEPTIAPLVDLWGFYEVEEPNPASGPTPIRGSRPPAKQEIEKALDKVIGYDQIEIDAAGRRIRLGSPEAALDFGGIVKGYGVDRLVGVLKANGVNHALVDLGGDLYALGKKPDGSLWRVAVTHPRKEGERLAVISLADKAVVTSGDYERYFEYEGVRYSHLLNPFTGYPNQGLISVTITAPTGAAADALATAVFTLGKEKAVELLESLPDVDGLLVDKDLNVTVTSGLKEFVELSAP